MNLTVKICKKKSFLNIHVALQLNSKESTSARLHKNSHLNETKFWVQEPLPFKSQGHHYLGIIRHDPHVKLSVGLPLILPRPTPVFNFINRILMTKMH